MYRILELFQIDHMYCVSIEGDISLLKNGIKLRDENGNDFIIESIGMTNYKSIKDYEKHAELFLKGNVDNIGRNLDIVN